MKSLRLLIVLVSLAFAASAWCQQPGSPWPKFRQNLLDTGLGLSGGSDGMLRWNFVAQDSISASPVVAADGTVYVGADDGNLYAINPDGTQKWAFPTQSAIESSPLIGPDGTIYVGSDDFNVYAIRPDGTQ